jgi:DNA-binding NarL/FixJ family response regulator
VKAIKEREPEKDLGLVWVNGPYEQAMMRVEEALGKGVRVYVGKQPPEGKIFSSVVFCSNTEDVGSEVRRVRHLQALAADAPVLVLGLRVTPQLSRSALLAGARGFLHLGMKPAQVVYVFLEASKGEIIVPRKLLEAFLVEAASRDDLAILSPRQQEILMLIAEAATSEGEIVLSRELLEDFLMEVAMVA